MIPTSALHWTRPRRPATLPVLLVGVMFVAGCVRKPEQTEKPEAKPSPSYACIKPLPTTAVRILLNGKEIANKDMQGADAAWDGVIDLKESSREGSFAVQTLTPDGWTDILESVEEDGFGGWKVRCKLLPQCYLGVDNRGGDGAMLTVGALSVPAPKDATAALQFPAPRRRATAAVTINGAEMGLLWSPSDASDAGGQKGNGTCF